MSDSDDDIVIATVVAFEEQLCKLHPENIRKRVELLILVAIRILCAEGATRMEAFEMIDTLSLGLMERGS